MFREQITEPENTWNKKRKELKGKNIQIPNLKVGTLKLVTVTDKITQLKISKDTEDKDKMIYQNK